MEHIQGHTALAHTNTSLIVVHIKGTARLECVPGCQYHVRQRHCVFAISELLQHFFFSFFYPPPVFPALWTSRDHSCLPFSPTSGWFSVPIARRFIELC